LRRVNKLLAAIAAIAIVVVVLVLTRRGSAPAARPANATPVAVAPATAEATSAPTSSHVKRITPDERRELAQKIDAARAARGQAATRAGERPSLPKTGSLADLPPGALDTVKAALPYLDACYHHGSNNYGPNLALALVTLHGAADVGTLVDASEIHDDKGAPIDKEVADCLASTLQSLQLPPLDVDVPVQFSFRY
jgi:hypothetical protein